METLLNIWTTHDSDYLHVSCGYMSPVLFSPLYPGTIAGAVSSGYEMRAFGRGVLGTEAARARDRYASGLFRLGVVGLILED